jgi:hypothetical protein
MTKEKLATGLQKAVKMEAVPSEKFSVIVQRTILGTLLVAFGVGGITHYEMNHYLGVGLVLLGATIWSTQLVTNSLKALIQPIAAIKRAVKDDA